MATQKPSPKSAENARKSASSWGGARKGAGRKANKLLAPHSSRELKRQCPMLITLVLRSDLPSLQDAKVFAAFHKGSQRARRHGLRVIEYAAYDKKIFLLCEFKNRKELESSMKSLNTTLAIAIKSEVKSQSGVSHKGPVFLGRYRMEILESPERVIEAQLRMLPQVEKDFAYSSLLCMSKLKATQLFSKYPLIQSLRENAEDRARAEGVMDFLAAVEQDPKYLPLKQEAITTTATPQFALTQSGWLRVG